MVQSPSWEANSRLASREISCLLWNPRVHYCSHKSPPPVSFLSQMNLIHTLPPYFLKINSNIILPSTPRSSKSSHHVSRPKFCTHCSPTDTCYMPRSSAHSILDNQHHLNNIWWRVQIFSSSPVASRSNEYRVFFPEVERSTRSAGLSPPSSAEVGMRVLPPLPCTSSWWNA
jgi:hypothetical protein